MGEMRNLMSQIIGNDTLKERLCRDIISNSLSHAYILEGKEGSGRKTIAQSVAAAIACTHKDNDAFTLPCLQCPSCRKILERKSPDVIFVSREEKASLGIDTTRFIKEDVHTVPNDLEHKFYIIEDADKMTVQAQNAFLLTLEEPPSFVHFFLICNDSSAMLETIRSRAPTLRTEPISEADIEEYICSKDTRAAQKRLSSPNEFKELIKASNMSIGTALELLEPDKWASISKRREFIKSFVSASIHKKDAKSIYSHSFASTREELAIQFSLVLSAIRDLIAVKKSDVAHLYFYADYNEAIELCDATSLSFLYNFYGAVFNAINENQKNANIKLLTNKMILTAQLL